MSVRNQKPCSLLMESGTFANAELLPGSWSCLLVKAEMSQVYIRILPDVSEEAASHSLFRFPEQ